MAFINKFTTADHTNRLDKLEEDTSKIMDVRLRNLEINNRVEDVENNLNEIKNSVDILTIKTNTLSNMVDFLFDNLPLLFGVTFGVFVYHVVLYFVFKYFCK